MHAFHKKSTGRILTYSIAIACTLGTALGLIAVIATAPAEAVTVSAAVKAKADGTVAMAAFASVMASALACIALVRRRFGL